MSVKSNTEPELGCSPNDDHVVNLFCRELFCQDKEENPLLGAYRRLTCPPSETESDRRDDFVLISGQMGIDRTTCAEMLRLVVEDDGGFFLSGRFQENCYAGPYSAFVSAFSEFAEMLSTSEEQMQRVRSAIEEELICEERLALVSMIPAMETIVGSKNSGSSTMANQMQGSSSVAQNKFPFLFCRFCRAVFTRERPLVLFLDDVQWASPVSVHLIDALLTNGNPKSILLVGSFQEGEPTDSLAQQGPFVTALGAWEERTSTEIIHIQLKELTMDMIEHAVQSVFALSTEKSESLSTLLQEQSNGEYAGVVQFLQHLLDQALLRRIEGSTEWIWNSRRARSDSLEKELSNHSLKSISSVDVTRETMESMPCFTKDVLKVAACMGPAIDNLALALVLDDSQKVAESLSAAEEGGILEFFPRFGGYRFRNRTCQEAAYSLIPVGERDEFKLRIGRKLWNMSSPKALKKNLFLIVNLLNKGKEIIEYQPEKYRLAELNLEAAEKATELSAFGDADTYLSHGIDLLGDDHWERKYSLSLALYHAAAEVAVVNAHFERVEVLIQEVFENARTLEDKIRSYLTLIGSLGQQDDLQQAEEIGFELLYELGEPFPKKVTRFQIVMDLLRTKRMLRGYSNKRLLELPEMTDESKITAMHVMNVLFPYAFLSRSPSVPLLAFRTLRLSLEDGLYPGSSVAFATYGTILCGAVGDVKEGYRFGQLAMSVVERNHAHQRWLPRVCGIVHGCINHWTLNLEESLEPLMQASRFAMKIGDVEMSMMTAVQRCYLCFYRGISLDILGRECDEVFQKLCDHRQENMLLAIRPLLQAIRNLTGATDNPQMLSGDLLNKDHVLKEAIETSNITVADTVFRVAMTIAYTFGDYTLASEMAEQSNEFQKAPSPALYSNALNKWYLGLVSVAAMLDSGRQDRSRMKVIKRTLKNLVKWSKASPSNFLHKQKLLEAELASLSQNRVRAMVKYDEAIEQATKHGFIHEAALACERASRHLQRAKDDSMACVYLTRSHSLYTQWGALTKAAQLH